MDEESKLESYLDRFSKCFHPGICFHNSQINEIDDIKVDQKTLLTYYYQRKEIRICTILIWRGADVNKICTEPLYSDYFDYFVT